MSDWKEWLTSHVVGIGKNSFGRIRKTLDQSLPPNDQVHRAAANDFEFKNRRGPPLRCNALLSRFHYGAAQWTTVLDIMLFGCELSE